MTETKDDVAGLVARLIRAADRADAIFDPNLGVLWREAADALTAAEAPIAGLEAALDEAIEFLEFWGEYASEYFRDKHDLAGDMASLRRAREALSRQEGGR